LEKEVKRLEIPVWDRHDCIRLGTVEEKGEKRIAGLILLDREKLSRDDEALSAVLCDNLIFGVGGPGGLYKSSVYPPVHVGAIGLALEIGAETANLTESQYGIGSVKFRWNLSGSYQQVLPRYFSRDRETGEEFSFLPDFFSSLKAETRAIFLKGYQWPFDPLKVEREGSSLIDILVYREMEILGRDVYMDFLSNPWEGRRDDFSPEELDEEVREYWAQSGLTGKTPLERLKQLNPGAIELYKDHNIDLSREPLQIGVCAQHNNGGLAGDIWWESLNVKHLFPVGEVNGTHGVYRPGGTALNSGQVGAFRAGQKIAHAYREVSLDRVTAEKACLTALDEMKSIREVLTGKTNEEGQKRFREELQNRMSRAAAFVRDASQIDRACAEAEAMLKTFPDMGVSSSQQLPNAFRNRHMALAQLFYLEAIRDYLAKDGGSRGSYIVKDSTGIPLHDKLEEEWRSKTDGGKLKNSIQHLRWEEGRITSRWETCRPIPEDESWFERVWASYLQGEIFS
ncbi:MAG: FAD-binding protein, partial [Spirochaetales bacterium]|nr:FAD-binding protein [Spirochaetales bacterium]